MTSIQLSASISSVTDNLSYFSIFKIIFLHQSYESLSIYSDQSFRNLYGDRINEVFPPEFKFIPKFFYDINACDTNPRKCEHKQHNFSNKLNIFYMIQSIRITEHHISNDENTVFISNYDVTPEINFGINASKWTRNKILFITKSKISFIKHQKNEFVLESKPIDSNQSIIAEIIQNTFYTNSYNMHGSDLIIFFRLMVPLSCFAYFGGNHFIYGPDGFLTEQISKILNASKNIVTDIGIQYPDYPEWFTKPEIKRYSALDFHKELVTTNYVSKLNQRFLNV